MSARSRASALGVVLLVGACASTGADRLSREAEAVAARLAPLHGVAAPPVRVLVLDDHDFDQRAGALVDPPSREADVWLAFGIAPRGTSSVEKRRSYDAGAVAAEYETGTKTIVLRRQHADLATLAHELAHRFADLVVQGVRDDLDAHLAIRALVEGHAEIIATAIDSRRLGHPLARAALDVAVELPPLPNEPAVDSVTQFLDDERRFLYFEGVPFAARIARSDGIAGLAAALRDPPQSTAEMLDDGPSLGIATVEALAVPGGWRPVVDDTFGLIHARSLVAACIGPRRAAHVVGGWLADRFVVVRRDESTGLLWSTAWRDDKNAIAFADAVAQLDESTS